MKGKLLPLPMLLALTSGPAFAADFPVKAPPPPAPPGWTGFYAGLNAGGIFGINSDSRNAGFTSSTLGANGLINSFGKQGNVGAALGGQIGYNWQFSPHWVFGAEADWQWSSLKTSGGSCTPPANTIAFFGAGTNGFGYCLSDENKLTNFGTARLRTGALVNEALWFVTGGAAWGTVKASGSYLGSANPLIFSTSQPGPFLPSAGSSSDTRFGWTIGAGVETKIDSRWSVKLEYLYVDLGDVGNSFAIPINRASAAFANGLATASQTAHITDHIARIGFNYKL
jgi:outer membrane immunogenic protein